MNQHLRLTLDDVLNRYQRGYLSAKGALGMWIEVRLACGWQTVINPKKIQNFFTKNNKPMARSTFWGALNALRDDGVIEFDQPARLRIKRLTPSDPEPEPSEIVDDVQDSVQPSEIVDDCPEFETTVQDSVPLSEIANEQPPESVTDKASTTSPDSSQISLKSFLSSLSNSERENFEKFVQEELAKLHFEVAFPEEFLQKNDRLEQLIQKWKSNCYQKSWKQTNIPGCVGEKANQFVNRLVEYFGLESVQRNIRSIYDNYCYANYCDTPISLDLLAEMQPKYAALELNWR